MVCKTYKELRENKKKGDRVFGIRHDAFKSVSVERWPEVQPVEGTLQSSYYEHPNHGPYPPRHLMPLDPVKGHSWDDEWWNVEDWIICDTLSEAEAELEIQMYAQIAKAKEQIQMMESLLPSVRAEELDDDGDLIVPPVFSRDMCVTFEEIMSVCVEDRTQGMVAGHPMTFSDFHKLVNGMIITDNDGFGDFIVDGVAYDNIYIICQEKRILVADRFEIPFERLEKIFEGHQIIIMWYNK